ncbi:DUF4870 domain-containing protein [Blastococcus sp. Marseille-P5729]|uniref:DUF4870 domain-containing protein n=1 Tax=Blastococcus sp. Marseille-P5729 TaxID=2086582 RepID=UPI000D0F7342|nr:DUF4870 domain-containing protein [Blastococcus sp. Marseille-P5729]
MTRPDIHSRDDVAAYDSEDRGAGVLAHLSAPIAFFLSAGWLSIVGPLIVWYMYKDRSPQVRRAAAGAFNFNISFWVMQVLGWVLVFTLIGIPVALLIWGVTFVVAAWCHIKGAIRAWNGRPYEYPFQIRILG